MILALIGGPYNRLRVCPVILLLFKNALVQKKFVQFHKCLGYFVQFYHCSLGICSQDMLPYSDIYEVPWHALILDFDAALRTICDETLDIALYQVHALKHKSS